MSETYTRDNYHPDVLPVRLRAEAKAAITEAVMEWDWKAHVQSGHGVSIEAPPPHDNEQYVKFSTTEKPGTKHMPSILRKIRRFGSRKERA